MSIFNVDNNYSSEKDLISLHKEFEDVPIIDLKFIYKALAGDYNRVVEFLVVIHQLLRNITILSAIVELSNKSEQCPQNKNLLAMSRKYILPT